MRFVRLGLSVLAWLFFVVAGADARAGQRHGWAAPGPTAATGAGTPARSSYEEA